MNGKTISVIVPAYNIAPWISRSLDSLLAQTHRDLEIIVVDDGSADNIREILTPYFEKHPNIRAIHKENGGVASARLRGVAEATGDWIGFMDGDDYVEPQMYARLLENALAADAQISHCGHQILFSDGRVEYVHKSEKVRTQDRRTALWELLDNRDVSLSLCTKLYRRELFQGIEAWTDTAIKYNEDLLMNYYLFNRAEAAVFEGVCPYHYILRQDSASCKGISENYIFDPIRVRQILLERCTPEMQNDVRQALIRNLLFNYAQLDTHADRNRFKDFRARVRAMLQEQQPYFHLLSLRNKALAMMICKAPWTFRIAYGTYVALFQREEQH